MISHMKLKNFALKSLDETSFKNKTKLHCTFIEIPLLAKFPHDPLKHIASHS